MNRWKAFTLHLLISLSVVSATALAGLLLWYPHGVYRLADFDRILLIILAIDIVAGPLLTFIVYKQGKPSLKFDLSVIAALQAAFFIYGLNTLAGGRPVFLVATDMRFNLVFANEIDDIALRRASKPQWRHLSWTGPVIVGARPPSDPEKRQDLLFSYMSTGADIHQLPEHYVNYGEVAPRLLRSAEITPGNIPKVPLVSRYGIGLISLDPVTAAPDKAERSNSD